MARTATAPIGAKMAGEKVKLPKTPRCARCRRRLRKVKLLDSMAQLEAGLVKELVCSGCLTTTEFVGMNIRDATMDVGLRDGRIVTRPKREHLK